MFNLFDDLPASNGGTEGERLRDEALDELCIRRPAVVRDLTRAAIQLALDHGTLTADDVRAVVPIPLGIRPCVVGAAIRAAGGILTKTSEYVHSRRPIAHARDIPVWRLADAAGAAAWLTDHPALSTT